MAYNIQDLITDCHRTAVSKGFWEKDENGHTRGLPECIALMHSELSEALEEVRKHDVTVQSLYYTNGGKPEGVAAEFADCVIRIFDTCAQFEIPLFEAMKLKMEYNKTRTYKHGKKL